jgi:hypothetical protein
MNIKVLLMVEEQYSVCYIGQGVEDDGGMEYKACMLKQVLPHTKLGKESSRLPHTVTISFS